MQINCPQEYLREFQRNQIGWLAGIMVRFFLLKAILRSAPDDYSGYCSEGNKRHPTEMLLPQKQIRNDYRRADS